MLTKQLLRVTTVIIMIITFGATSVFADNMGSYMSTQLDQIKNLAPHAYEGQQRGYFVGGTMHVPPLGQKIQPLSITLPSIKDNSCGGIDVAMGGFSFLNFQYLVQKLQSIIQAAPALAFEIAIKVLSEKLGGVMHGLEEITEAINGLNFNSCTAMNGIVNTASNAITNAISGSAEETTSEQSGGKTDFFGNGINNFIDKLSQGWTDLMNGLKGTYHDPNNPDPNALSDASGVAPKDGVLNDANRQIGGLPADFINVVRYYVGDIVASTIPGDDNNTPSAVGTVYPACADNAKVFLDDLSNGNIYSISFEDLQQGLCPQATASETQPGNTIVDKVKSYLDDIYKGLTENQDLSTNSSVVNFINSCRIPVYSFMREAAILNNPAVAEALKEKLAEPIAYEFTANVVARLTAAVGNQIGKIEADAQSDASGVNNQQYIDSLKDYKKELQRFQISVMEAADAAYDKAARIYGDFMRQYQELTIEVQQQMQQKGSNLSKALAFQRNLNK
jgi:conjugative transfer pilus assembly protein TraH